MLPAHPPNMVLALLYRRPAVQREYTASPPTRHSCAPSTSHGFISLGTTTPLPTAAVESYISPTFDYFSLPKMNAVISPDAGAYEPHGFIPLCSVAPVERENEGSDYFSHSEKQANTRVSTSASTSTPGKSEHGSISLSLRHLDFTKQKIFSNSGMKHPTGSPVLPRDVFHPSKRADSGFDKGYTLTTPTKREHKPYLSMRGGAIYDPVEHAFGAERNRCSLTGYPMDDVGGEDEFNDELLPSRSSSPTRQNNLADVGAESNRRERPDQCKETDKIRQSWEKNWVCMAEALELPASETGDIDGDDNSPFQTRVQAEKTPPQAAYKNNIVAEPDSATVNVARSQPSFSFVSPQIDTPIPEVPTEAPIPLQASDLVRPKTPITQMIPPANLLTVPRPPARPRLAKRHSSPISSTASLTMQLDKINPSTSTLSGPPPPTRPTIHKRQSPSMPPDLTILKTAMHTDPRYLTSLLKGPTIYITANDPSTILIPSVPLSMLTHFCPSATLSPLLSPDRSTLTVPSDPSLKSGLSRVLRFMTRCCLPNSHSSNSELLIPTNDLGAGIETVVVCEILGLRADASRLTSLLIGTQLHGPLSSSTIDELWNGYNGSLRSTSFGDLVVYFTLHETWENDYARSEEILWTLEQPEYSELKERVRDEVGLRRWRKESQEEFLARWEKERARSKRRKEKKEMVEREREARVEEIRRRNREVKGRSMNVGAKAKRVLDLDVDNALPKTPGTPGMGVESEAGTSVDRDDEQVSTAALYAEYARSFRAAKDSPQRQAVGAQTSGERCMSDNSIRVEPRRPDPTVKYRAQSTGPWDMLRGGPVPRKKVSLWDRLKI